MASVHGTVALSATEVRRIANLGNQFLLAPSGRRDYALQDKARPLHRVAVKRCCLEAQPLPARLITDNGYNPAIDNRADVA